MTINSSMFHSNIPVDDVLQLCSYSVVVPFDGPVVKSYRATQRFSAHLALLCELAIQESAVATLLLNLVLLTTKITIKDALRS